SNSTVRLLEALAPLRAMGMTDQEAVQAGFGRFPVGGRATFGDDWWYPRFGPAPGQVRLHEGTDIFAPYGTPARAPADGTLRQVFNALGGLSAYVVQADGTYFYLAHLARYEAGQVSGQAVRAGDVIGYVGDSGNARGGSPHIHFEVHPRGGGPVNPKPWLDARLREALAAVPAVIAAAAPGLAARAQPVTEEQDLTVAGHTDLGGGGGFGAVAVAGDTALVARDFAPPGTVRPSPCRGTVAVVDLSDPSAPVEAGTIDLPGGRRAEDVDALAVRTPAFTGHLAAVVTGPCAAGDGATGVAYFDVTDPARPRHLGGVNHPRELADAVPGAGGADPCAVPLRGTCPRRHRSVELQQAGGRVLSLSSTGGRDAASRSEALVVDATDPRAPRPVGAGPLAGRARPAPAGDGCAPVILDRPPPASGGLPAMVDIARFRWQADAVPAPEAGPGGPRPYATTVTVGGRRLAAVADDDWWSSTWALRIDRPAAAAGDRPGCAGPLPGGDLPDGSGAGGPAGPTAGGVVYVGRACPERRTAEGAVVPADPWLADPAGRIAVADAALAPAQAGLPAQGCSPASRLARARADGALGLVVAGSFLAAEAAGEVVLGAGTGGGDAPAVPGVQLRKPDGDAVRAALCPAAAGTDGCGPAEAVAGSLVELPGRWGGLRLVDVTDPDAPREVRAFATPNATAAAPAEAGRSFALHALAADDARLYAAWGSDGLRVLDVAGGTPVEVANFLPPPAGGDEAPYVAGVDATEGHIVVSDLTSGLWVVDKRPPAGTRGYWLADEDGGVFAFGDAPFLGSAAGAGLEDPVVGMAASPTGRGYWLVTGDGGVHAFGDAPFAGSHPTPSPAVGMAATPSGRGYWVATADGGVYAFGDAAFLGARPADPSAAPVVAVVSTPSGRGYWLVAGDGGVFSFGDAPFLGSTAGLPGIERVVAAAATPSGLGYWLAAADGGVFAFGDARFKGSLVGRPGLAAVAAVAPMAGVRGYWLAGADGAVHALGTPYLGARPVGDRHPAVAAMAAVPAPR
ncbi:MAG TPA: peptidoglycan DD-metalloendopeptidase family protein, partial [Acidimicrobiales bacterium]|nr:peptidoglycan DD-metalloendopeptidase family protein [Acidimicrobiales bacterium]